MQALAGSVFTKVALPLDPIDEGEFEAIMGLLDKICRLLDEKVVDRAMDRATLNDKLVVKFEALSNEEEPVDHTLGDLYELAVALRQSSAKLDELAKDTKEGWTTIVQERMRRQMARAEAMQNTTFGKYFEPCRLGLMGVLGMRPFPAQGLGKR